MLILIQYLNFTARFQLQKCLLVGRLTQQIVRPDYPIQVELVHTHGTGRESLTNLRLYVIPWVEERNVVCPASLDKLQVALAGIGVTTRPHDVFHDLEAKRVIGCMNEVMAGRLSSLRFDPKWDRELDAHVNAK